jgi:hypothetical protein
MSEKRKRGFRQVSLETVMLLFVAAGTLSAEMCWEDQIGARPIHREGQVRFYGTPFETYIGVSQADLLIYQKRQVPGFYINVALNSAFWLSVVVIFYFLFRVWREARRQ